MLTVKTFEVGAYATNCYVVSGAQSREAIIIDPGFNSPQEAEDAFSFIEEKGLQVKFIVNTHGHPDHTCGNELIKNKFHVPICIHEADAVMLGESGWSTARYFGFDCVSPAADILLHDGETVKFCKSTLKVVHSPGHSPGGMLLIGEKEVFSGDTLFAGSIGRTDFPASFERDMNSSLKKLLTLPDSLVVYPGHGPASTLGAEKRANPFLLGLNFS